MQEIPSVEQYITAIRSTEKPVIMLFSADWCPDCRYLERFIDEVVDAHQEYDFYQVDTEQFPELCETYDVMGIPSFLAYQSGQVVGRFVNRNRKTRGEVEGFLQQVEETLQQAAASQGDSGQADAPQANRGSAHAPQTNRGSADAAQMTGQPSETRAGGYGREQ